MKILFVHNYYRLRGGEDAGVIQERDLLAAHGHRIVEYSRDSAEIRMGGVGEALRLGSAAIWSWRSYREIRALLRREHPEIAYFHNLVPLISPSAYYACGREQVPVVQTLHNYRLFCPAGQCYRQGQICEECLRHGLFQGVRHRCYRHSAAATAAVAAMLTVHRHLRTWSSRVDCFIARSEFARHWFVRAGIDPGKLVVKPCFVERDPGPRSRRGEAAIFVGRLTPEKGVPTLLRVWRRLRSKIPLRIVGDGPLRGEVEQAAREDRGIEFLGWLHQASVFEQMKRARFLMLPSEWYEGLPLTTIQAFACGVPVLAFRVGSVSEIVEHGRTGLQLKPGDDEELSAAVEWAWSNPSLIDRMGRNARAEYEAKYTARLNYDALMKISERVISTRRERNA